MTDKLLQEIKNHIKVSEGLSLMPYEDTHQFLTIGYGRCLDIRGISKDEAEYLFNNDIKIAVDDVKKIVNRFDELPEQVKIVLIDLSFNLGLSKLLKFENFLDAIDARDFAKACAELKDSRWWHQVGTRATRNYNLLQECIKD